MKNKKSVIMCFICLSIFILGFNIYTKACIRKDNKMDEISTSCKVDSDYPSSKNTKDKGNIKMIDEKVKISDNVSLLVNAVVIYKNSTLMFYTIEDSRGKLGAWTYAGIISNIKIDNINYTNSEWTVPSDENHYEILYYGIPSKKEKQINISIETEEYGTKKLSLPIDKVNFVDKECKKCNKLDEEIQVSNNIFEDKSNFNKKNFLENDGKMTFEHFDDKKILHEINMQKGEKLIVQYDSEIKEGYFFIWISSPKNQIIDGLIKKNEKGVKEIIVKENGVYKIGVLGVNTSGKAEVFVRDLEDNYKTYEKSNKDDKNERYFEEIKNFDYDGIKNINIDADCVSISIKKQ